MLAALFVPVPETEELTPAEWRADLIVAALTERGMLPPPEPPPITSSDLDRIAAWLADQSGHPRYTVSADINHAAGWERLRVSETDVMVAFTAATRGLLDSARHQELAAARDTLVAAIRRGDTR